MTHILRVIYGATIQSVQSKRAMATDNDRLLEAIAQLRGDMEQGLSSLRGDMERGFSSLRGDMERGLSSLRGDMEQGFNEVKEQIGGVEDNAEKRFNEVKERIDGVEDNAEKRFNTMNGKLTNLVGSDAERKVHSNIINIASDKLSMSGVTVMRSQITPMSRDLQTKIDSAMENDRITAEQASDLRRADIIISGIQKNDNTKPVYAVTEVSVTIGDSDIRRARDRAGILGSVMDGQAVGFVVGGAVAKAQSDLAEENGVSIFIDQDLTPQQA